MSDLMFRTAGELAGLVRTRELTPRELVEASLSRIDALDGRINAFSHVAHESALADAAAIRPGDPRPFAGVPIAVKDNRPVAGMPLTNGSDLFRDLVADHDAHVVRRLREAGFVIVGKTTLPEFGILPTTESRRLGSTRNPWDPERTPGGSSGGAAAAVAAGMVPIAHGNDGGGSIRIPAACCGLVGLKAARGRVSVGPDAGQSFLVTDGVLSRDVGDTVALLDVLAGPEPGDATWAPPVPTPYAALAAIEPGTLRVGLALQPALESASVDPVCVEAARAVAGRLEELGHHVEEVDPGWGREGLLATFTKAFGPLSAMGVWYGARLAGRDPRPEDVEPLSWAMWERANSGSALELLLAQANLERLARELVTRLSPYDVVITPALATRPVPIGEIHGRGPDPMGHYRRSGHFTPFTAIVNVMGVPAISLPVLHGDDGLPLAVQLIGPPAREEVVLRTARQLEAAMPWADRRPPLQP